MPRSMNRTLTDMRKNMFDSYVNQYYGINTNYKHTLNDTARPAVENIRIKMGRWSAIGMPLSFNLLNV